MNRQFLKLIPNRYSVITAFILLGNMALWNFNAYAQSEYPDTYDTLPPPPVIQPPPPEVLFNPTPAPCPPNDQICMAAYLETLKGNVGGAVSAQVPPSPVYTRGIKEGAHCALGDKQKCDEQEKEWNEKWLPQATQMELDFYAKKGCKQVYDYWGFTYYYQCQQQ